MTVRLDEILKDIKPYVLGWMGAGNAATGSGTSGQLAKWVGPTALGDSIVAESGPVLTADPGGTGNHTQLILKSAGNHYIALNWKNQGREYLWQLVPTTDTPASRFRLYDLTGGAERLTVLTSGNVGVGTASPGAKLHVGAGDVLLDNNQAYRVKDTGGNAQAIAKISAGNRVNLGSLGAIAGGGDVEFYNNGVLGGTLDGNRDWQMQKGVTVDAGGANSGTLTNALRFGSSTSTEGIGSNRSVGGNNQNGVDIFTASTRRLSVTSGGNVGVGIHNPGEKLTVAGGSVLIDNARAYRAVNASGAATSLLQLNASDTCQVGSLSAVSGLKPGIEFYVSGSLAAEFNAARRFLASNGATITGLSVTGDATTTDSVLIGSGADKASGARVVALQNATAPSGTPSGGGVLYVEAGSLKFKGSSGTVTTLAPA